MELIAFTPAAALLLATLASDYALSEDEACAVLRGLRTDHGRGIVSVAAVEQYIAAVVADRAAARQAAFAAGCAELLADAGLRLA